MSDFRPNYKAVLEMVSTELDKRNEFELGLFNLLDQVAADIDCLIDDCESLAKDARENSRKLNEAIDEISRNLDTHNCIKMLSPNTDAELFMALNPELFDENGDSK